MWNFIKFVLKRAQKYANVVSKIVLNLATKKFADIYIFFLSHFACQENAY